MKTLTLSLWLACIGMVHAQLNAKPIDCTFDTSFENSSANQISTSLSTGIWQGHDQSGHSITLHFFENGTVQWLTHHSDRRASSRLFNWECLPDYQSDALLVLSDWQSGEPMIFSTEAHCNALSISAAGCQLELGYTKSASKADIQRTTQLLTGNWENTTYPFDFDPEDKTALQEAYLNYCFMPDGRFVREIGNSERQIKERGSWVVAKDGEHLIMSFDNGKATVAQLKYVRVDELVIHHLLSCQDEAFNTVEKNFFFNRV